MVGLKDLHKLTSGGNYGLQVDLRDFSNNCHVAVYEQFKVKLYILILVLGCILLNSAFWTLALPNLCYAMWDNNKYRFPGRLQKGAIQYIICQSWWKNQRLNLLQHIALFLSYHWCHNGICWKRLLNRDSFNKRTCAWDRFNWWQCFASQRGEGKDKGWKRDISSQSLNTQGERQRRKIHWEINWEGEKPFQPCFTGRSASEQSFRVRWPFHQKWPRSQYGSIWRD